VMAIGLITSAFTAVRLGPGRDHMSANEHTYATTPACRNVDHVIRWTATRLTNGVTTQAPPAQRRS
jgi:hypothetical protein